MPAESWAPRKVIEAQYRKALRRLSSCLGNLVEGFDFQSPDEVMAALDRYVTTDFFTALADAAAKKMITGLRVDGAKTWRMAARKSMRGHAIHEALKEELRGPVGWHVRELVAENAKLISSFPEDIREHMGNFIAEKAQTGIRSSEIARMLTSSFPELAQGRIDLIARTETSKASTALTQARSEDLGLLWYIWRTSKDTRVRSAHNHMEGVVCSWSDPPNPEKLNDEKSTAGSYAPGNVWNCRCFPEPLIHLDQVKWPAKVHRNGSIQHMTRAKFESISPARREAIA